MPPFSNAPQEFIRVGYYVNNEYADEALREAPPPFVAIDRVVRNILAEKPRVTRFPCAFDAPALSAEEGAEAAAAGGYGEQSGFGGVAMGTGGDSFGFGGAAGMAAATADGGEMMMA